MEAYVWLAAQLLLRLAASFARLVWWLLPSPIATTVPPLPVVGHFPVAAVGLLVVLFAAAVGLQGPPFALGLLVPRGWWPGVLAAFC